MAIPATEKMANKIHEKGLFEKDQLLICVEADAIHISGAESGKNERNIAETIVKKLMRKALIWVRPSDPLKSIIDYLVHTSGGGIIKPEDYESSVLIGEIPICDIPSVENMLETLGKGRTTIIRSGGMITTARSNLEVAYTLLCALCFSCYVKFFTEILTKGISKSDWKKMRGAVEEILHSHRRRVSQKFGLMKGPFHREGEIIAAMVEAGSIMVNVGLVDANFGNISYRHGDTLFISKRGAPLDGLTGQITMVTLDKEIPPPDASTEYPTHRGIATKTTYRTVCHGHPLFAVIMSLNCSEKSLCPHRERCHTHCPRNRELEGIPIVSGNAGGGPLGLNQTVPPAVARAGAAIALGHGVFTAGHRDFNEAVKALQRVENLCLESYLSLLEGEKIGISGNI